MRVKVASTIVTFPKDDDIIVYNYLTKDAVQIAPRDVYWLTLAGEWTEVDDLEERHPSLDRTSLISEIDALVDAGILLEEGSEAACREAAYRDLWELGIAAGMFHCSVIDNAYCSQDESADWQRNRAESDPSPELFWQNSEGHIPLPAPPSSAASPIFRVMERRRTIRKARPEPIKLQELSECLFAGLGITGFVRTETAMLPLKMTPSGGARNPFEAYVWVRNVEGLEPGIYHYSALQHSLARTAGEPGFSVAEMTQRQDWADDMPAIIILVAVLRRTTWKYQDPNAYRVVMIEAGHIAQNMMLACANRGLSACPTAALKHSETSAALGLADITQTPVYALLVGRPAESDDVVIPNPRLHIAREKRLTA
jgi:SagB-type dehydrogenase family enzyme